MEQGLPYISVKMACSLDGRTALNNGSSQWITSAAARRDVQFLRARASAVLSSAQTVLDDDPSLNLRLSKQDLKQVFEVRQPVRVLIDSRLRLSGSEKLFGITGQVWVYTANEDKFRHERLVERGAEVIVVATDADGRVDLGATLQDLAQRGINDVHVECGQRLAGALVAQGLADEIVLYLAPHLLGSAARGAFDLGEFTDMEQRVSCSIRDLRQVGDDLRLRLNIDRD
jgi:diaminohydroxyphosphoribosylaminopyrimidine deaminase/5-amino-6-(5-phosphoribosylamino)uracil reductase